MEEEKKGARGNANFDSQVYGNTVSGVRHLRNKNRAQNLNNPQSMI